MSVDFDAIKKWLNVRINPITSIRARIGYAIIILTLALTFILSSVIGQVALQQVETNTTLFSARVARGFALYTDTQITHLIDDFELIAFSISFVEQSQIREMLTRAQRQFGEISEVNLTSTDGTVLYSSNRSKEGQQILADYHSRMLNVNPIRLEIDTICAQTEIINEPDSASFFIVVPIFDKRTLQFTGTIAILIREDWIFQIAGRVPFDDGLELIVLASDGTPIIGEFEDQTFALEIANTERTPDFRHAIHRLPDGTTNLVGYAPVLSGEPASGLGWTIVLQRPLEVATAPITKLQQYIVGAGCILALMFSVIGWILSGEVVKPLGELVDAAQRIQKHESNAEFPLLQGHGELAVLSQSLVKVMKDLNRQSEARQLSEDRFGTIFRESLDVILVLDGDTGLILSTNPVIRPVLGYEPYNLIGVHFSKLIPHTDDDSEFIDQIQIFGSVFETLTFLRADGSICPMDLTATIIPWGERTAVLATLRDVSERQVVYEAIEKAETLQAELEREREFARMKEAFVSMVSHEFRTPLTVISSSVSIIDGYYDRLTDERKREHLAKIQTQTAYLTSMMDDMLTLSRAQSSRLEFHPEPMNVTEFCNDIMHQIRQIDEEQHLFNIQMTQQDINALADKQLLRHILFNLLSNAIKYSPSGTTIWFSLENSNQQLTFEIRDEGIGIPEEQHKNLFTPFFRAKNVGNIKGTGLGLSIVKESVVIYGGQIDFISVPERGTKFIIQLPIPSSDNTNNKIDGQ